MDITGLEAGTDYTYYFEAKDINNNPATGEATIEQNGPIVTNLMPSITLTQPETNTTVNQGDSVIIEWQSTNTLSGQVHIFMDVDNVWANGNEVPVDFLLPLSGSLTWNTTEVPPGKIISQGG